MLEFCDCHCHLQFPEYAPNAQEVYDGAIAAGVTKMITVGTNAVDSQKAVDFAINHDGVWSSVGSHPHYAGHFEESNELLRELVGQPKVVAIGECGLDFYRSQTSKTDQKAALRWQIELALELNLPLIFHIREAYDDFWPIFDEYQNIRGVAHCFTGHRQDLDKVLERGLYVGLNGIATFSQDELQLAAFKAVPLNRLLLETDAPLLTPAPLRGTINEPKQVKVVAEFLGNLRGETLKDLANNSTNNAHLLFGI